MLDVSTNDAAAAVALLCEPRVEEQHEISGEMSEMYEVEYDQERVSNCFILEIFYNISSSENFAYTSNVFPVDFKQLWTKITDSVYSD